MPRLPFCLALHCAVMTALMFNAVAFAQSSTGRPREAEAASLGKDGHFTTSDGVRLHYRSKGTGRPIVFVPGWTMPGEIWEPQIREFSRRYRTIALDPRAQGRSEMTGEGLFNSRRGRDVWELLEHLNLSDAVVVGWSMGVREVLTSIGQSGTARISAIALVEGDLWVQGDPLSRMELVRRMQADRLAFTKEFVRGMYVQPQSEEYFDRVTEMSMRTPTSAAATLTVASAIGPDTDMRQYFGKIDKPLLYVGVLAKKPQTDVLKAAVPAARIELLPAAGHALFVDQAQRFNALLEEMITSSASTR
jgi:microsomal epoxide hydrolase